MVVNEKRAALLPAGMGPKRRRWYPHEALWTIATQRIVAEPDEAGLPWYLLAAADAAEHQPALRTNLRDLTRFVAMWRPSQRVARR